MTDNYPDNALPAPCCGDPANCVRHPHKPKVSAHGKLNRFGELCTGTNCAVHQSLMYRSLWDAEAAEIAAGTAPASSSVPHPVSRGLGDDVANLIHKVSGGKIKPCGGCKKRQAKLNHWFPKGPVEPIQFLQLTAPVRNLVMHVCPIAGNGVWQWNVDQVLNRIDLFNGQRVLTIAEQTKSRQNKYQLDPPGDVLQRFKGVKLDHVLIAPNNETTGEQSHFLPALDLIANVDPRECTFRCHAKGVRYDHSEFPVREWTETMYAVNLDNWDLVQEHLEKFALTGCFKRYGKLGAYKWYYSGAFYWIRHAHAFARDWRHMEASYHGTESWPARHFRRDECGCLFFDKVGRLYSRNYWETKIAPAYQQWEAERTSTMNANPTTVIPPAVTPPASATYDVTLITPTGDRPDAFRLCEQWMERQTFGGSVQWIVVDDGIVPTECTAGQLYLRRKPSNPGESYSRPNRKRRHTLPQNLLAALPHVRGRHVLFIEDDEWYAPDYIATMSKLLESHPLVGEYPARYYYVRPKRYRLLPEHKHCSLCRTGIRATHLNQLQAAIDGDDPSIDMRLWDRFEGHVCRHTSERPLTVGFKGLPGRPSGGGDAASGLPDNDLSRLEEWIGDDVAWYRKFTAAT